LFSRRLALKQATTTGKQPKLVGNKFKTTNNALTHTLLKFCNRTKKKLGHNYVTLALKQKDSK